MKKEERGDLNLKNKEDFYFVTNFINCLFDSYKLLLQASGLNESDYVIELEAFSLMGERLPNYMALYITKDKEEERNLFYYLSDHAPEDTAKIYRDHGYPILQKKHFCCLCRNVKSLSEISMRRT